MSDERETIQRNPESVAAWKRECAFLREQVEKLEALVVMRCDLDVPPQFSQGLQPHEVLEPVTAEHCQWFVAKIEKLTKERDEYKSGFEAAASKYRNLKLQMQEAPASFLFSERKPWHSKKP